MKIALDFDSVLSDTMISWVKHYNIKTGSKYTKEHITQWEFWNDFGIKKEEAVEIFRMSWEKWEELIPTEDDLSTKTQSLAKIGTVDIVSNVEPEHEKSVISWLEHNKIEYTSFVRSNHDKEKLDYDYYVDDDPRLAANLEEMNKHCFLYHQKWNESINGNHITRIHSISDVISNLQP